MIIGGFVGYVEKLGLVVGKRRGFRIVFRFRFWSYRYMVVYGSGIFIGER